MSLVLSYPGGTLKTVTIAATAGNVVTNKAPGAGKRWIVLSGYVLLDTDVNAANRRIVLAITDGTNILQNLGFTNIVTANQLGQVDFGGVGTLTGWSPGTLGSTNIDEYFEIQGLLIEGVDQVRITITAGLAGDSYSGFFRVLELGITP